MMPGKGSSVFLPLMRKIKLRFKKSSFAQGVLTLSGSTVISQGVGILAFPVLTRLYTPRDIGLWGLFMSFVGVASVAGALRYEVAVVAAPDDGEANSLVRSALLIAVVVAVVAGIIFGAFKHYGVLGYGVFPLWTSALVSLTLVVTVWGQILRYWAIRHKKFRLIGAFALGRSVLRAIAQGALFVWQTFGMIVGESMGRFGSLLILWRAFSLRGGEERVRTSGAFNVLLKYRVYPLTLLPSALLDTVALMAAVPIFASVYGIEAGGALALAQKVTSIPMSLIGAAVADVFYGHAADLAHNHPTKLLGFLLATVAKLSVLAVGMGGLAWWLAPRLTPVIFGPQWAISGDMMAEMVPWLIGMLAVSPVTRAIFLTKHPWTKLLYDIPAVVVVSLPLWVSIQGPLQALILISWLQGLLYGVYLLLLVILIRQEYHEDNKPCAVLQD